MTGRVRASSTRRSCNTPASNSAYSSSSSDAKRASDLSTSNSTLSIGGDELTVKLTHTVKKYVNKLKTKEEVTVSEVKRRLALQSQVWTQAPNFQAAIGAVICVNSITLGLEVDHAEEYADFFFIFEHLLTTIFVIELVIRLKVEGLRAYFSDSPNIIDFLLVVMSVIDVWILALIMNDQESNLRMMSLLRMVRLMRLARLVRLFRIFKELTVLLRGIAGSWKGIFWASVFLALMLYIFGIFATFFFGRASKCSGNELSFESLENSEGDCDMYAFHLPEHTQQSLFGTLARSMLTLYMCTTEGCGFEVIQPMAYQNPWVMIYWYFFYFITVFGLMNVIVGLFCDNIMQSAMNTEKELKQQNYERRLEQIEQLKHLFVAIDTDHSGVITRDEYFAAIQDNKEVMDCMEALGLHDESGLFDKLDITSEGEITLDEFFMGAQQMLLGDEPARTKDIVPTFLTCQYIRRLLEPSPPQPSKCASPPTSPRLLEPAKGDDGSAPCRRSNSKRELPVSSTDTDGSPPLRSTSPSNKLDGGSKVQVANAEGPQVMENGMDYNKIPSAALEALAQRLEKTLRDEVQTLHTRIDRVIEHVDDRLQGLTRDGCMQSSRRRIESRKCTTSDGDSNDSLSRSLLSL